LKSEEFLISGDVGDNICLWWLKKAAFSSEKAIHAPDEMSSLKLFPIWRAVGDLLWFGKISAISKGHVAIILAPDQSSAMIAEICIQYEIDNVNSIHVTFTPLVSIASDLSHVDFCAVIPSMQLIIFSNYADHESKNSIEFWSTVLVNESSESPTNTVADKLLATLVYKERGKGNYTGTVSSMCASDSPFPLLVTGLANNKIKLWVISNYLCSKATKRKHATFPSLARDAHYFTLRGHSDPVYSVAVWEGRDSQRVLFSGSGDGTIRIWNISNVSESCCLRVLSNHNGYIYTVAVQQMRSPRLFSAGVDAKVNIWDIKPVIQELNWTRRRHFCQFIVGCGFINRLKFHLFLSILWHSFSNLSLLANAVKSPLISKRRSNHMDFRTQTQCFLLTPMTQFPSYCST
jgi:WD40 repeat protein